MEDDALKKIRMSKKISSGIIAVLMTLTVLGGQTSQVYADEYVSETTEKANLSVESTNSEESMQQTSETQNTPTENEDSGQTQENSDINVLPEGINDDPEAYRWEHRQATITDDYGIAPFALEDNMDIAGYGIDVSQHNGVIDWQKVRNSGVEFALIRVGYRGWGPSGTLVEDSKARQNLEGATKAGIRVGAYFFSTAITEEEAREEAQFALDIVKNYEITYPIIYDNEGMYKVYYNGEMVEGRDYDLTATQRTDMAIAFLDCIRNAGYYPMMYGNTSCYKNYDGRGFEVGRLENSYDIWVAEYFWYDADTKQEYPSFESARIRETTYTGVHSIWQFSSQGQIDGISGNVDLDFCYNDIYDSTRLVRQFVKRLYTLVLGRDADSAGLVAWTDQLIKKNNTAAEVAFGFVYSKEFQEKNLSDEDYIDILYQTCLGRDSDAVGKAAWIDCLNGGFSRRYVLRGFIESMEFSELCADVGIERGSIEMIENRDKNDNTTKFVRRCYNVFLDREPDADGLNEWTGQILENTDNAREVPYGFVFSREMTDKKLSNEAFVAILYKGIMDREPDADGLKAWTAVLDKGESRYHVYEGFVYSNEFTELLSKYGL